MSKPTKQQNPVYSNTNMDRVHSETIRKELRHHKLYEHYMLTPTKVHEETNR